MKKILFLVLMISACASKKVETAAVNASSQQFSLRPSHQVTLDNQLKIIFVRDSSLPQVSFHLLIRSGLMNEKKELAGLNMITAGLLDQGSTSLDALRFADALGELGTEMNIVPSAEFTYVALDALSKDKDLALTLVTEAVLHPAFTPSEVERTRAQILAQIQKKVDNASGFADDQFDQFILTGHPYARDEMGDAKSVRRITRRDILKHYQDWFRPNNSILAVVGNFKEDFEQKVVESFKKWQKATLPSLPTASLKPFDGLQVKLVSKAGLKQTQIRLGRLGLPRKTPDYLTLRLANEVLGGGSSSSRLMQRVRDDLGLTYGVFSSFDFRKDNGDFSISTFTKNESVGQTLAEVIGVYNQFVEKGVTEGELAAAKAQMIGQFPRAIETADRYAFNLLALEFHEIPVSYLTDFMKNVEAISVEQVNQAIKKYLTSGNLKVLIYGDEKAILSQVESYKPEIVRIQSP